jgi:hypothetical protein
MTLRIKNINAVWAIFILYCSGYHEDVKITKNNSALSMSYHYLKQEVKDFMIFT